MPTVILRGSKNGHKVARLVLEGSSSNPIRYGDLNGAPFEVTDEEFAKLERSYVLEPADVKSDDTPSPPEQGDDDNQEDET
jgi:hypothetical protein